MLKLENYVPPMKEELDEQVYAVDTSKRMTYLPSFFYDYFIDTFMIEAYTCDKVKTHLGQYPEANETYACYCNNGDFHTMPEINLEVQDQDYQYDMAAQNYMFLPFLSDSATPMTKCILGLQSTKTTVGKNEMELVILGQRAMAEFPYYTVYDREAETATIELGDSQKNNENSSLGAEIAISSTIVIALFAMLVYLIYLRRARIQAEEWLELHKNTLFSQTAMKTEEEILEALVKSKELRDKLENNKSAAASNANQTA